LDISFGLGWAVERRRAVVERSRVVEHIRVVERSRVVVDRQLGRVAVVDRQLGRVAVVDRQLGRVLARTLLAAVPGIAFHRRPALEH